jgi:hypothetical protein
MFKKVALISGEPRSGKTTLANKLAGPSDRIHLDHVVLMAGIKYPDLLPPEIDPTDTDITTDLSIKIQVFTTHLALAQRLDILLEEFKLLARARSLRRVRVIEGNCLPLLRDGLVEMLVSEGIVPIDVILVDDGVHVGGDLLDFNAAVRHLNFQLDARSLKYF